MKLFRKEEGFTLVELMVVVLIIGILVAIAIPVFNSAKASAWRRSCHANQRTIEGAAQSYNAEYEIMPADVPALVTGSYLKALPKCKRPNSSVFLAGTYTIDSSGTVAPCTAGDGGGGDHGHF